MYRRQTLRKEDASRQIPWSMQPMKTPIRQRQLRGLVRHHRRHPATHPRRLVNRTARWKEPPQDGTCRWCYERTAHIKTRWHPYCLNAYRVASGQHPEEIQHTFCEICGDPSDEMDHGLAIEVARALGPAAVLRAFTPDNLRWLCRSFHRRKTRQDRRLVKFLAACSLDWCGTLRLFRRHSRWVCRSYCRAAWSLLRGRQARADGGLQARGFRKLRSPLRRCNKWGRNVALEIGAFRLIWGGPHS